MKKKHSTLKDILFLSISSFIVVVAWVGFNLYHSWVTTTITPELQISIKPITPDFDFFTINQLKSRKQVIPVTTLSNVVIEPTPTIAPPATVVPATPAAFVSPTPSAIPNQPQVQPEPSDIPGTIQGE